MSIKGVISQLDRSISAFYYYQIFGNLLNIYILYKISSESRLCRKLFIDGSTSLRKTLQDIVSNHKNLIKLFLFRCTKTYLGFEHYLLFFLYCKTICDFELYIGTLSQLLLEVLQDFIGIAACNGLGSSAISSPVDYC